MENNTESKLTLINEKNLTVTNVSKIIEAKPNLVLINLKNKELAITGSNLEIKKLDTVSGFLEVEGEVTQLKYSSIKNPTTFLKKIFK